MTTDRSELLEKSYFSNVPFHVVPREDSPVWAGDKETRDELLRVVNEVKHGSIELSHFTLIYGDYGSGKTHSLKFVESNLKQHGSVITAYLKKPKVEKKGSFQGIVQEAIKQIGERPLRTAAEPFVKYIEDETKRQAMDDIDPTTVDGDLSKYIDKRSADIKRNLQEELYSPFPELFELFEGLVKEDDAAWRYFTGSAPAKELGRFGLASPMDDDHDAFKALAGIYQVLTTKYEQIPDTPVYDAAYLFIDELEQFLEIKLDEIVSIRAGLRDLFDVCTQHFCMCLAATAENASAFHGLLEEALMVRVTAEPIHIQTHDEIEEGTAFLKDLMDNFREGSAPDPYHPFTEDSLKATVDRTTLPKTARKLIKNCRRVWETNSDVITKGGTIGTDEVDAVIGLE